MSKIQFSLWLLFASVACMAQTEPQIAVFVADSISNVSNNDCGEIFTIVEKAPSFPGGDDSLKLFIEKNNRIPAGTERCTVFIQLTISKTGSIVESKIMRGCSDACNAEALRIISIMPQWTPALQRGLPVCVVYIIPFIFR